MKGETAAEFLTERRDFLRVMVRRSPRGGYDVCLRLDGTYSNVEDAAAVAILLRRSIEALVDLPRDGWDAWDILERGRDGG